VGARGVVFAAASFEAAVAAMIRRRSMTKKAQHRAYAIVRRKPTARIEEGVVGSTAMSSAPAAQAARSAVLTVSWVAQPGVPRRA